MYNSQERIFATCENAPAKGSSTRPGPKVVEERPGFHLELGGNEEIQVFLSLEKEHSFITSSRF